MRAEGNQRVKYFPRFSGFRIGWIVLSNPGGKILAENHVHRERNKSHFDHIVFKVPVGCPNGDIWQLVICLWS